MKVHIVTVLLLLFLDDVALGHSKHSNNHNKRIINGETAAIADYPYYVIVDYYSSLFSDPFTCGGSLISPNHVLTAGHCVANMYKSNFKIRAGVGFRWNYLTNQVSSVQEIYLHEGYKVVSNMGVPIDDIAVMKLTSSFNINSYVKTIPLPAIGSDPSSSLATVTGFGNTVPGISSASLCLLKATVPVISNADCKEAIKSAYTLANLPVLDTNVCTKSEKRACNGDSGGPLAQDGSLIGVVSWAIFPCGSPTVYTKVSKYVDWINEQVAK